MSMADNTQKRTDFLADSFTPKSKDPEGDPLAELARLIGQSDPFVEQGRKPLDSVRASDRPAPGAPAARGAPAPGSAPAPEWLARPAARDDDAQGGDYGQHDPYPPADDRTAHAEESYAPQPGQGAGHGYRPLASVFAADGARSQRHQPAGHEGDAHYDPQYQDGYE